MKSKADKALHTFKSGLNCAQAVLTAYSEDLGFDNGLALNLSCGFGGGMGRLQVSVESVRSVVRSFKIGISFQT